MSTGVTLARRAASAALILGALMAAGGCKKTQGNGIVHYTRIDSATAGTIQGVIRLTKEPPPRVAIATAEDPGCSPGKDGPQLSEDYVVDKGRMANVFVYVKSGLGGAVYAPPTTPVVLMQKGCRYIPHVLGVMAGQPVEFETSDMTIHNINVQPSTAANLPLNTDQAAKGAAIRHVFAQPETMIPVRCNYHPWMQAYINVTANPFYAVSDSEGHYEIHGLPPGTYVLSAIQEELGSQQQSVTVTAHQTAEANFIYAGH